VLELLNSPSTLLLFLEVFIHLSMFAAVIMNFVPFFGLMPSLVSSFTPWTRGNAFVCLMMFFPIMIALRCRSWLHDRQLAVFPSSERTTYPKVVSLTTLLISSSLPTNSDGCPVARKPGVPPTAPSRREE